MRLEGTTGRSPAYDIVDSYGRIVGNSEVTVQKVMRVHSARQTETRWLL
jgi:hypothetical protein